VRSELSGILLVKKCLLCSSSSTPPPAPLTHLHVEHLRVAVALRRRWGLAEGLRTGQLQGRQPVARPNSVRISTLVAQSLDHPRQPLHRAGMKGGVASPIHRVGDFFSVRASVVVFIQLPRTHRPQHTDYLGRVFGVLAVAHNHVNRSSSHHVLLQNLRRAERSINKLVYQWLVCSSSSRLASEASQQRHTLVVTSSLRSRLASLTARSLTHLTPIRN